MSDIETPVESPTDIPEEVPEVDPIQTIYEGQSESLSGRSTLTFSVGRHPDTGALHLRIVGNTGGECGATSGFPALRSTPSSSETRN